MAPRAHGWCCTTRRSGSATSACLDVCISPVDVEVHHAYTNRLGQTIIAESARSRHEQCVPRNIGCRADGYRSMAPACPLVRVVLAHAGADDLSGCVDDHDVARGDRVCSVLCYCWSLAEIGENLGSREAMLPIGQMHALLGLLTAQARVVALGCDIKQSYWRFATVHKYQVAGCT